MLFSDKCFYDNLTARNWGFITPENQAKMRKTRILLAGCGLGSSIAVLAARTGFCNFIIADGDKVEISNLNRQAFRTNHTGRNKAEVTAELIKEINNEAEIKVIPRFIIENDVPDLVKDADLVVNMVDPAPVIFTLTEKATARNKAVFFPLNIGFGGVVLAFTANSIKLDDMIPRETPKGEFFIRLAQKFAPYVPYLPHYMEMFSATMQEIIAEKRPGPQLGIAVNITSALTVTAMVKWVFGQPLKLAPEPLYLDSSF
ncbi:MAG: ThiF family adenylyltransferase [Chloroflexi bacterium]|nr:ThiF family adenylyltransferase [Chloroflexota bacterium]